MFPRWLAVIAGAAVCETHMTAGVTLRSWRLGISVGGSWVMMMGTCQESKV